MILILQFFQHEASTLLSLILLGALLQVFTVMKKHNLVYVRIPCSLGSSATDKYTVPLLSGRPEYGGR